MQERARVGVATLAAFLLAGGHVLAAPSEISATDLYQRFADQEIAAAQTFAGKSILIDGTVGGVGRDLGAAYVALKTNSTVFSVQCYFKAEHAKVLAALRTGQEVRLRGTVRKKLGNVLVYDCVLLKAVD
jgi:tRNA_anti-like